MELCYRDSYARVKKALEGSGGKQLPAWNERTRFCRLWGNSIRNDGKWLHYPFKYRGKGAPGALALKKMAKLVPMRKIWAGELRPGAVIQTWKTKDLFQRVRKGEKPKKDPIYGIYLERGHSFIFIKYVDPRNPKKGMKVEDNGHHTQHKHPVKRGAWGFWVGANFS